MILNIQGISLSCSRFSTQQTPILITFEINTQLMPQIPHCLYTNPFSIRTVLFSVYRVETNNIMKITRNRKIYREILSALNQWMWIIV